MSRVGRVLPLLLVVLLAVACGGDTNGESATDTSEPDDTTTGTTDPADDGPQGGEAGAVSVSVGDGSWEITEIFECEVGDETSADFRQFSGASADGETEFTMSWFPDESLSGLNGVSLETTVDGNDWSYASSYAGSDGAYNVTLTEDGSEGTAEVGVVGIDAPDGLSNLVWSISCG